MTKRPQSAPDRGASPPHGRVRMGWIAQGVLITIVGGVALAPPASGAMLLVPVGADAQGRAATLATHADARVLGSGPLPGSLYVEGSRARLLLRALSHGMLLLDGEFVGCTQERTE